MTPQQQARRHPSVHQVLSDTRCPGVQDQSVQFGNGKVQNAITQVFVFRDPLDLLETQAAILEDERKVFRLPRLAPHVDKPVVSLVTLADDLLFCCTQMLGRETEAQFFDAERQSQREHWRIRPTSLVLC